MTPTSSNPLQPTRFAVPFAACALALALAACGGGASDPAANATDGPPGTTTTTPDTTTATAVRLGGVAATGAPLAGATVKVWDATGAKVCEVTTAADGTYGCDLGTAPKAPFVIEAEVGEVKLVSAFGSATSGTANITPITTLIAATLAADGNPLSLVSNLAQGTSTLTSDALKAAVDKVATALKPLTDQLGATIDPIGGTFRADGTGYDKVLDALQVSIRPDGATSNVEVTVKAQPTSEDAAPVAISFQANASSIPPLPRTINLGDVTGTNVPAAIADFLSRVNACYALPTAERVSDGANVGSTVTAAACRTLFVDDDPASFLSNGQRVGPQLGAAFGNLFREGGTGVRWDSGAFSFFRVSGDWVIAYRFVGPDGSTSPEQMVVRNVGGALKMVGNQYAYSAGVRPIVQLRDHLVTPAASNLSVGYNVQIANRVDGSGNPVFAKAEVTAPNGVRFVYKPTAGLSYLAIERPNGTMTATPIIRLAGRLTAQGATAHPADVDTSLFFGDRSVWTEDAIRGIPDQSVWKIEFFHADGTTPNVVQAYRTVSRAMTLAEASQVRFADAVPAVKAALRTDGAAGYVLFDGTPSAQTPQFADLSNDGGDFWAVPVGAVAPTSVSIFGRAPSAGPRYNDTVGVPSSARKATIQCSAQSVGDLHCAAAPLRNQYATHTSVNLIELWGRDTRQMEYSTMNALYLLTVPGAQ
jgi:hypothetical protein